MAIFHWWNLFIATVLRHVVYGNGVWSSLRRSLFTVLPVKREKLKTNYLRWNVCDPHQESHFKHSNGSLSISKQVMKWYVDATFGLQLCSKRIPLDSVQPPLDCLPRKHHLIKTIRTLRTTSITECVVSSFLSPEVSLFYRT